MANVREGVGSVEREDTEPESFGKSSIAFQHFFKNLPLGVAVVDHDGTVRFQNQYLLSFHSNLGPYGSYKFWELNLGLDEIAFNKALLLLKSGSFQETLSDVIIKKQDGIEVSHSVDVFCPDVNALQFVFVFRNNESKNVLQNRFEQLQEVSEIGYLEIEVASHRIWVSPFLSQLLEAKPLSIEYLNDFFSLIPKDEADEVKSTFEKALETKRPFTSNFRLKTNTEDTIHLKLDGKVVVDSNQKPLRIIASIQNISDRLNFETALIESKRLFQTFMDINPAEVFIKDEHGVYIYGNAAWAEQFNKPLSDLLGKKETDILPKSQLKQLKGFKKRLNEKGLLNLEKQILKEKQGTRHWSTFYFPIETKDGGKLIGGFGIDITQIKKAQDQIKLKQDELDSILGSLCTGVIKIDLSLAIIYSNPSACDILNLKKDENDHYVFQTDWEFLDDNEEPIGTTFLPIQEALFLGKSIPNLELGIKNDNEIKWLSINISAIKENDRIKGVVVNFIDISPRKKAFKKVKESENLLNSINTNIKEGIFRQSEKQGLIYVNDAYLNIFGFEDFAEAKKHKYELTYFNPEDRESYFSELKKKGSLDREILMRQKNGSLFWATMNCSLYTDKNGEELVDGAVRNINNEKLATQKIHRNERQLRSILDHSEDLIFLIDPEMNLTAFNSNFSKYIQKRYHKKAKVGMLLNTVFNNESNVWFTRVKKALSNKKNGYYIDDFEDSVFEVKIALTEELNLIKGVTVFIKDITSLKSQEKVLEEQNKALHKANEELDRFVYSASHDLRAPLTSLLGLIALGYQEKDIEILRQYMELMEKSVKKLDDFILDIINYSKNSRKEVDPEPIEFETVISKIVENLKYLNRSNFIEVKLDIKLDTILVSDSTRITMIFNNLISNAIRYADVEKKHCYVKIKIRNITKGIKIIVEDNGIGIEEEHLAKIFDMFYRATDKKQGSGLGLYIVKEAIKALKGRINVTSEYKVGTKFTLFIPHISK